MSANNLLAAIDPVIFFLENYDEEQERKLAKKLARKRKSGVLSELLMKR